MASIIAMALLLGAGAPTAAKASTSMSARFEIDGKSVSEAEFSARKRALHDTVEYHCKKTTFGGVVTYKAHDASGSWFRVTLVSGGAHPSRIEPVAAPEGAATKLPKQYRVYKGPELVLEITDAPGPVVSTSAPPPPPGSKPATNPFLSASAHAPLEEGKLRELLDASHSTAEYLGKLRHAGYRVEETR